MWLVHEIEHSRAQGAPWTGGPCDINLYLLYGYRSRVRGYERCARNAHVSRGTGCVRMVQQSPRNQEENA